jgi:hypothetical protein
MKSFRSMTLLALVACALFGVSAVAEAKPASGGTKTAKFKATLSGTQVTTWEYHHVKDKDNPCDASSNGYGDQTISFDAKRKFDVQFTAPPRKQPDLFGSNGRPSVFTTPLILNVDAKVERNGDYSVNYGEVDESRCPGVGGGDGGGPDPKDCGIRDGRFNVSLFFHERIGDDDLFVPIGKPQPERNNLKLQGSNYEWIGGALGSGATLDFVYLNCPLLMQGAYVEKAGNIFTSGAKISERKLLRGKQRKIVVSGHHIQSRSEGEYTGKTIIAWNLRLTRVK